MELLKNRIRKDGKVAEGDVLKVDSFLNHQLDVGLLKSIGEEFYRLYKDDNVTKILTIEASGISIACMAALAFDCPVVFAKKTKTINISGEVYRHEVRSYTHGRTYEITVSKDFIKLGDRILIIDDFLAMGNALEALVSIVESAGATVVGAGIAIEKSYQPGRERLTKHGLRIESLARIDHMSPETGVHFVDDNG